MTGTVHPLRTDRYTDADGHTWPVTGHWCTACGLPLIPAGSDRHPTCEPAS